MLNSMGKLSVLCNWHEMQSTHKQFLASFEDCVTDFRVTTLRHEFNNVYKN